LRMLVGGECPCRVVRSERHDIATHGRDCACAVAVLRASRSASAAAEVMRQRPQVSVDADTHDSQRHAV